MKKSTQLAMLLPVLCSGQAFAGGGAAGNNTRAANYTALAAQLSALRLSNSSNATGNNTGQEHNRSLHAASASQAPARLQASGHHKKNDAVVYGKKAPNTPPQESPQRQKRARQP